MDQIIKLGQINKIHHLKRGKKCVIHWRSILLWNVEQFNEDDDDDHDDDKDHEEFLRLQEKTENNSLTNECEYNR